MSDPIRMVSVPVDVLRELIDASSEVRDLLANVPEMQDRKYVGTGNRFVNAIGAAQRSYLSAAPAPEGGAVEGPEDDELPGDFLARVGMDGALWADGFRKMALKLGYSDMDEGWLIGWFCNAVMAGYDHAQRRFDPALATAEVGERETLRVLLDNLVIAQCLSKELRQRATDEARSYLYALRAQPPARSGEGQ